MTFRYEPDDKKAEIVNECLSDEYDEYIAIAKGKYFYERVEGNPRGVDLFSTIVNSEQKTEQYVTTHINSIRSIDIFFPHEPITKNETYDFALDVLFMFCVRCEILSYLKQLLPPPLKKKMKSIGYFERPRKVVDVTFLGTIKSLIEAEIVGLIRHKHLNKIYDMYVGGKRVRIVRVVNEQVQCREINEEYEQIF